MAKGNKIPYATVRKYMKEVGASVVAKETVEYIRNEVGDYVKKMTTNATKIARNAKHKKLTKKDVELAVKMTGCS